MRILLGFGTRKLSLWCLNKEVGLTHLPSLGSSRGRQTLPLSFLVMMTSGKTDVLAAYPSSTEWIIFLRRSLVPRIVKPPLANLPAIV